MLVHQRVTWHWTCSSKVVNQSLWKYASLSPQKRKRKSYPQQFHLHVSRRWEFQVAFCQQSPNLVSPSCHRMASFTFRSVNPPSCVSQCHGCYKPYSWRNDHHSLSWNEAFGNSYPHEPSFQWRHDVRFPFIQIYISNFARWPITGWWYTYPSEKISSSVGTKIHSCSSHHQPDYELSLTIINHH